jgi:fructokinase
MSRFAIGIDLGGTKVEACLVDENRKILARKRRPSEPRLGREKVLVNILELVAETAGGAPYEAVGMGTPGTYHPVVENDANCLALAEFFAQCHGKYDTVMAVILGTGMGAGLILGNRLHRGPNGNAGEIGHTSIDINGRLCECGRRGCGEAYLSGPSLTRRYQELSGETLAPRDIFGRYESGEPKALALFAESCRVMGELFANAINTLDLQAIILGGGVSNIPLWYEGVPPYMDKAVFGIPGRRMPILKAVLGDSAGVLGAAFLGLREMGFMQF